MEKLLQKVLLKKNAVLLDMQLNDVADKDLASALALVKTSFNSLGFELTEKSYQLLSRLDPISLTRWYNDTYKFLSDEIGASVKHKVFYGNFPNFDDMSELEMEIRRILSYLTFDENFIGVGAVEETERPELQEETKMTVLSVVSEKDSTEILVNYAKNYLGSKLAIPQAELPTIELIYKTFGVICVPEEIPFKETFVWYVSNCLGGLAGLRFLLHAKKSSYDELVQKLFKTSTDILRFYAAVSNSSVELIKGVTKFSSLKREERRMLLGYLENIAQKNLYIMDDLAGKKFLWIKAAEMLHSSEYSKEYPEACGVLDDLRNGEYQTFNSKVHEAIMQKDIKRACSLLSKKPGYFARELDYLLREFSNETDLILSSFKDVADSISSPVLHQLILLFNNRKSINGKRVFKLKENKFWTSEDTRKDISLLNSAKVITSIYSALEKRYSTGERKRVYLSDSMSNYAIPESCRLSSSGFKTLTFGSKLDISLSKYLRFFVHWKNMPKHAVDIDLSAECYKEDLSPTHISLSWHNLSGLRNYNCTHSGDVRTAPNGASEFIDLDLDALRTNTADIRYIVISICSYSCESFRDIPECFAGFMERVDPRTGKIFEPKTVKTKFDLVSNNQTSVIMVVDLKDNKVIWADSPLGIGTRVAYGNANVAMLLQNATKTRVSLRDLVLMHKSHLDFITKEEALQAIEDGATDVLIIDDTDDATLTPYDIDEWNTWL